MQDPSVKAPAQSTSRAARSYVLRFISGKYQGGEFPVVAEKQIVVGRSSELDMVLVEDMVSRKHAKIAMQSDQIWIEDLGSTNGTFVNGEKIKRARLKEGDRVLIGTSILKLIASEGHTDNSNDARVQLENVAAARCRAASRRSPSPISCSSSGPRRKAGSS
jgi:pSer/pThr/pTyr-binding forkhead associated (FHA) protein